ncbi:hypothetical protein OCGS_0874 [Oceaniovalibus guishaninsula JLT2003]|uniref:Cupin type-2 domain-containing protein n=1 Tax=Oceaniovalibus guishaninsula JLT2003 TaxID=1231392 RepID=K2HR19_9RHOB|nr:cupin domain-containing protein [Oceaniovalibus guishaninsula]EKE45179.1 hypothetical protein OCGS_0874 [Oceaniovalibus guishaninsula JLT2003]
MTPVGKSVPAGFAVDAASCPDKGGDPAFGSVLWRTLVSADRTPSAGMVAGMAILGPGGTLNAHRHSPPEIYFGIEGNGVVLIDGARHLISSGVAVYIPGDAEHSAVAGQGGLRFFYVFPADRFDEVDYRFSPPRDPAVI